MREVTEIVATATELSYQDLHNVLQNTQAQLESIPHDLLLAKTRIDDLQLDLENTERELLQLELAASVGINNNGKLRAEQHLQDQTKKIKAKLTSARLDQDNLRTKKVHLESLKADLEAQKIQLEQKASSKKSKILQDKERAYLENDVHGKAVKALSDFLVYTSLKLRMNPKTIRLDSLVWQEVNKDSVLIKHATETFDSILSGAEAKSYE